MAPTVANAVSEPRWLIPGGSVTNDASLISQRHYRINARGTHGRINDESRLAGKNRFVPARWQRQKWAGGLHSRVRKPASFWPGVKNLPNHFGAVDTLVF